MGVSLYFVPEISISIVTLFSAVPIFTMPIDSTTLVVDAAGADNIVVIVAVVVFVTDKEAIPAPELVSSK